MKQRNHILKMMVVTLVFLSTGCCTTNHVTRKASKHYEVDKEGQAIEVDGNPAYYLLVPLTIPCDIIIAPGVVIYWLHTLHSMGNWGDGSGSN